MPILLKKDREDRFGALDKLIAQNGVEDLLIYLAVEHGIVLQPKLDPEIEDVSVDEAFDTFEQEDLAHRPNKTQKTYRSELHQFREFIEKLGLQNEILRNCFTASVLSDYLSRYTKVSTGNKKRSFLRTMKAFLTKQNWLPNFDLEETLKLGRVFQQIPRALDKKQIGELLEIAKRRRYGLRYFVLFTFMVGTGTRIEEATTLRWGGNLLGRK